MAHSFRTSLANRSDNFTHPMRSALKSCQKRKKLTGFYQGAQHGGRGERRDSFIKRTAMLVVSLKGINYEPQSHLQTQVFIAERQQSQPSRSCSGLHTIITDFVLKSVIFFARCLRTWESSVFQFPFALPTLSVEVFTVTPVMSDVEGHWSLTFSLPLLFPGFHVQCNLQLQHNQTYVLFVVQERFLFHCHINTQL